MRMKLWPAPASAGALLLSLFAISGSARAQSRPACGDSLAGAAARRASGSSAAVADSLDARVREARTFSDLLTARFPGVSVQRSSGASGSGSRIRVRGNSAVVGTNEPIVVVDGVRLFAPTSDLWLGPRAFSLAPSRLDDILPEDVECVEVLRGPAAAALYGVGASNGVILVTTRRGDPDLRLRARAAVEGGVVEQRADFPRLYQRTGRTAQGTVIPACQLLASAAGQCTPDPVRAYEPFANGGDFRVGRLRTADASVTGGVRGLGVLLGGRVSSEDGTLATDAVRRTAGRLRVSAPRWRGVDADAGLSVLDGRTRLPFEQDFLGRSLTRAYLARDPLTPGGAGALPPDEMRQDVRRTVAGASARWRGAGRVVAGAHAGRDGVRRDHRHLLDPSGAQSVADLGATRARTVTTTFGADAAASWTRLGGRLGLTTEVGVERVRETNDDRWEWSSPGGSYMANWRLPRLTTLSISARERASWGERLTLAAALVRGSAGGNAVPKDLDAGYLPAADAAWRMPTARLPFAGRWLGDVVVRGAVGATADARTLTAFAFVLSPFPPGVPGPALPEMERTAERELGADAELFGGRVTAGVTRYRKVTRNAIVLARISPSAGGGEFPQNGARVRNRGTELAVRARVLDRRSVGLELDGAWAANDNTLLRLGVAPFTVGGLQLFAEGEPLGVLISRPYSYRDINSDGVLTPDEVTLDIASALERRGPPEPRREGSLRGDLRLPGGVHVFATLDRRSGQWTFDRTGTLRCSIVLPTCRGALDPSAPLAEQAQVVLLRRAGQDAFVQDASYTRLRTLGVSARLPGVRSLEATFLAHNVATWTSFVGPDPEVNAAPAPSLERFQQFAQPLPRAVSLRLTAAW